ncbi:GNAT family N-acetyltransferase [Amycolatopsis sp. WAC 01416]|uniref:GNAT family N-acetyltransferase n=1 Tax=Amycolatopsis sp. WAC 01416 TaxID=2203196 RepID=UPI000F7939B3|nr:GNAT family N-acetyltransferase [Amycolatopsis sp. WAC 01416]RSN32153.1 GNAT family N-acetyltransferase [Amycolatopsis sp. WAC 01416]
METGPIVRDADRDDVMAICRFGEEHVQSHYTPLIGEEAAALQVRMWWNETNVAGAVARGSVVVADDGGHLVGVGQRGLDGAEHVIYKLYVHPRHRGGGLGRQLLDVLIGQLPPGTERLYIEHFVANERAAAFYEREGFRVERIDARLGVVWRVRDLR